MPSPSRSARALRALLALVVALAAGTALVLSRGEEPGGPDDVWNLIFGPPDLGPVDFATLQRRRRPNDALICPADVCPNARIDREPPVFAVPGERLRAILRQVATAEPDTQLVFEARWGEQDRYVARSPLLRFPDTINAEIVGRGEGRSTLALYSRSQVGLGDLGVNRRRLERWLARIEAAARA